MSNIFKIIKSLPAIAVFLPEIIKFADNMIALEKLKKINKNLKVKLSISLISNIALLAAFIIVLILYLHK